MLDDSSVTKGYAFDILHLSIVGFGEHDHVWTGQVSAL